MQDTIYMYDPFFKKTHLDSRTRVQAPARAPWPSR